MNKELVGKLKSAIVYQPYFEERKRSGVPLSYVLLSGGPDSATVLYQVVKAGIYKGVEHEVRGLYVNFGQPYLIQELNAANAVAESLGIKLEILKIPGISKAFKGKGELGYPIFRELLPVVIGAAAVHALFNGSNTLYHGNIAEDELDIPGTNVLLATIAQGITAMPGAEGFQILVPLAGLPKADVMIRALETDVPLDITMSCLQKGGHCGHCRACYRRAKAFRDANIKDPTSYRIDPLGE